MIRQHLTTGIPSLTFHPWPWTQSSLHRGQSSISSHQSHIYAAPFHSLWPFLAQTSITTPYPFPDIWENTNTSQSLPAVCCPVHMHAHFFLLKWWLLYNMICVDTLSEDLWVYTRGCYLKTCLQRYQHLHWNMRGAETPEQTGSLTDSQ